MNEVTETRELAVAEEHELELRKLFPLTADDVLFQSNLIQQVMDKALKPGIHYGIISEGMKPSLLKAGAEKMCFLFRIRQGVPQIEEHKLPDGHIEIVVTTPFMDARGKMLGYGYGSCTTMETKYRFRRGERVCPACGQKTIIKGKAEFGGGFLCWTKKGGCGEKFDDNDPDILSQEVGQVENTNIADTYNTVRKIAKKRSYVDGTLTVTGSSDFFTQDIEDMSEEELERMQLSKKPKAEGTKSVPKTKAQPEAKMASSGNPKLDLIRESLLQRAGAGANKNANTVQIMARRIFHIGWEDIEKMDDEALNKICFDLGIPNV